MPVKSEVVGKDIAAALGLDSEKISSIHLILEAGQPAFVTLEMYPDHVEFERIIKILGLYRLTEME